MKLSVNLLYPANKEYRLESRKGLPKDFVDDLELKMVARRILPQNEGYALKILEELCNDPDIIRYREDVLEDILAYSELETVLCGVIKNIYDFERTVEAKNRNACSLIDISVRLQAIENYIECVINCYEFAKNNSLKSEGLCTLMDEIIAVRESEDFSVLIREIKDLKNIMDKTVQSAVIGINFDSNKRPFEMAVLSISNDLLKEQTLLAKIFNRKTKNDIQPVGVMHRINRNDPKMPSTPFEIALFDDLNTVNNDILNHFSVALNTYYRSNIDYFLDIQQQLDFYLGAKRLYHEMQSYGLHFCRPVIAEKEERVLEIQNMVDLPLAIQVWEQSWKNRSVMNLVCNDVTMNDDGRIFILTGPNHGGKTTYTRAVGVCQVLFQAGLLVPGLAARMSPVDHIYTHFPKEEVVGINTSRLTQECKQCKQTFSRATSYSMILMNESFSSTTYKECLYIASGFIRVMRKIGCRGIFATHMLDLAKNIPELEQQTHGDSKIVSMVAQIEEGSSGTNAPHKLTYKVCRGEPYSYSYAEEILDKYGINFDEMLSAESRDLVGSHK